MRRVYLDSCIVIYLIEAADPVRDAVSRALRPQSGARPEAFVSFLTRLECRVGPLRTGAAEVLAAFDRFFASRDLKRCRLTEKVYDAAAELRAIFGVKTPDAIHLAAALSAGCDEFWTNDHRLPAAIEERIAVRVLP